MCAYHCAQLSYTTQHREVLLIFHLILQTIIIAQMMGGGGQLMTTTCHTIPVHTDKPVNSLNISHTMHEDAAPCCAAAGCRPSWLHPSCQVHARRLHAGAGYHPPRPTHSQTTQSSAEYRPPAGNYTHAHVHSTYRHSTIYHVSAALISDQSNVFCLLWVLTGWLIDWVGFNVPLNTL